MLAALEKLAALFVRGGPVMWPLLALSLFSLALCFERAVFWARTHGGVQRRRTAALAARVRAGDPAGARALAEADASVYARFVTMMLGPGGSSPAIREADLREGVEEVRPAIERFSVTLSTIITAAPMLGILGTVTGIIRSFGLLGGREAAVDPARVADGIAEALYTTVFGLAVALVTLFPYVIFRAHSDRALARIEAIGAAMLQAFGARDDQPGAASPGRGQAPDS